jgi:hypothetical protein
MRHDCTLNLSMPSTMPSTTTTVQIRRERAGCVPFGSAQGAENSKHNLASGKHTGAGLPHATVIRHAISN